MPGELDAGRCVVPLSISEQKNGTGGEEKKKKVKGNWGGKKSREKDSAKKTVPPGTSE